MSPFLGIIAYQHVLCLARYAKSINNWAIMNKALGLLYLAGVYLLSFGVAMYAGTALYLYTEMPPLLIVFISDILATIFIFIAGIIRKSPSVYDPYWSVQTFLFMVFLMLIYRNWNLGSILVLAVVGIYSVRLTWNFCIGFDDLNYVDWRYKMLKAKTGRFFPFVNFFGIHMMPTVLVYLASVPMFLYAKEGTFHPLDLIGLIFMLGAVAIEATADIQMKRWAKTRKSREEVISVGLWNYSRHPNYLGEISFWAGGALLMLPRLIQGSNEWQWLSGAVFMVLLFVFISIPMIEKNFLSYKPAYGDYQKRVHMLLLLPPKTKDSKK